MEDDFEEDYVEEEVYYEEDDLENNEDNEDNEDDITEDEVSEVYQPKIEKKNDPIADLSSKSRNVIIVPSEERITDNRLHKNEVSFILSTRAKQIAKDGTYFIENKNWTNAITIAYNELYSHKCPLKIRRQVGVSAKGDIIVEEWDTKTMVLPNIPPL